MLKGKVYINNYYIKNKLKESIKNVLLTMNSVFVACDMSTKGTAIPVQALRVPRG